MKKQKWIKVDATEVLKTTKDGKLLLFGEPITNIDLQNLKQEARALENFKLWRVMQETLKNAAVERGLVNSLNWETTLSAKMMLYSLDILKNILDIAKVYQQPVKVKPGAQPKRGTMGL